MLQKSTLPLTKEYALVPQPTEASLYLCTISCCVVLILGSIECALATKFGGEVGAVEKCATKDAKFRMC